MEKRIKSVLDARRNWRLMAREDRRVAGRGIAIQNSGPGEAALRYYMRVAAEAEAASAKLGE